MEFRVLGPLEVIDDGRELSIRGRKLQALLALLLLNAGETVSRDRLIGELWGDDPPATAAKTLQVHVSRLRRELGDVVVTRGGGYAIEVAPPQLDLHRFEALVAEGREAVADRRPEYAEARLREALGLWRGPPLPELADEPFARIEIGRLEQIRLDALEDHAEAEVSLGRHAEAIETLEGLTARHPYRERSRALLMLALYRSGRQAEALDAYRDARRVLVDAQGIEPGPQLRELHEAILAQDPAIDGARGSELAAPAAASAPSPVPPPAPRRTSAARRGFAWPAVGLIALLVAAGALVTVALSGGDDGSPQVLSDDSHAVAVIDPATNEVTTAATVGTNPGPLAFEPRSRSLWVGNVDDESVTRIHLRPVRTGRTIPIGERPVGLAAGDGAVWVAAASRDRAFVTARRIDTRFDTPGRPVRIESLPEGTASIALGGRSLWVASSFGRVTGLDPATGELTGRRIDPGHSPTGLAANGRAVWLADRPAGVVTRVDRRTGAPHPIPVAGAPADVALGANAVWVSAALDDSVVRIDPTTGSVRSTTPVGRRPAGLAAGAGAVWVANSGDGTVSRLDPGTGGSRIRSSRRQPAGCRGRGWPRVGQRAPSPARRRGGAGGIVRVETPTSRGLPRPGARLRRSGGLADPVRHLREALELPRRDRRGRSALSPELAESFPGLPAAGDVYLQDPQRLPVLAAVRRAGHCAYAQVLDRAEHAPAHAGARAGFMSDLVGASAYAAGSARHVSGITAAGNTLRMRLTRPSSSFLHRLSLPFFCAVPIGTPTDLRACVRCRRPGPYYVASYAPDQEVVLRRNPNYRGPRPRKPDQVRITLKARQAATIARVERGEVDYAAFLEDRSSVRRLASRYGPESAAARAGRQRYFAHPLLHLNYLAFNTSRGPFTSARLRRAVNYAIDRRALAPEGLFHGLPATPTAEYLPPGMPGHRDARIYPLTPQLTEARELAGTTRRSVVLYALSDPEHQRVAEIVKANLRTIGMNVQIRALGDPALFVRLARRGEPFDIAVVGWQSDYPDPLDFLHQLDGRTIGPDGNVNFAYFDDAGYNRRLDAAAGLASPARELALGRLAVDVARTAAPWAAIGNERTLVLLRPDRLPAPPPGLRNRCGRALHPRQRCALTASSTSCHPCDRRPSSAPCCRRCHCRCFFLALTAPAALAAPAGGARASWKSQPRDLLMPFLRRPSYCLSFLTLGP